MFTLRDFVTESNRIEGINRPPTAKEIAATQAFINLMMPTTKDLVELVAAIAPGHVLRTQRGQDVRVGDHIAPPGGPEIQPSLDSILAMAHEGSHPWRIHLDYETLHPFTDGNGRSGRALWLWQMQTAPLGFLHQFYYQTLSGIRR